MSNTVSIDGSLYVDAIQISLEQRQLAQKLRETVVFNCRQEDCPAGRLAELVLADAQLNQTGMIRSPRDAAFAFRSQVDTWHKEHFLVAGLDARNRPLYVETVSIGSLNANLVHPREVFKRAINESAAALLLGHNHPSGDLSPSQEDLTLIGRLQEAGKLLGIEVLDHLIFDERRYLSFRVEDHL